MHFKIPRISCLGFYSCFSLVVARMDEDFIVNGLFLGHQIGAYG